mgnify:CR=1 FL=1
MGKRKAVVKGGGVVVGLGKKKRVDWRRRKKRKRLNKIIFNYWPKIRPAPNGAQKLEKIENIILRRNMKTICRNSIRFAN